MIINRRGMGWWALAFAVASCASPAAGVNPVGGPAAPTAAVAPSAPVAVATPAPATAPSLPAAPPVAAGARVRLSGTVLFNDTPISDASVVAQDLATGKALALTPWTAAPAARRLLQTIQTDAKGQFDVAVPKLEAGQLVKVVVTKGSQTFTAIFNDRGQAIGADEVTTARYTLQQGQATTIEIRLRLTAASTAATQAFEGALKLTFQLPAEKSAERRSAALEAARKAAQAVAAALAKLPLSAIPGLRGISLGSRPSLASAESAHPWASPSLDKSDVAARIVSSVNSAGDVTNLEAFRTAVTNLGVFTDLFRAVQGELLAISVEKLQAPTGLDPIRARHFPLDDVLITASGFLGFSGQKQPITLAGQVQIHFIPSAGRGGGGRAPTPQTSPEPRWVSLYTSPVRPVGLAYLRTPVAGAQLVFADFYNFAEGLKFLRLNASTAELVATRVTAVLPYGVAQASDTIGTLYVGTGGAGVRFGAAASSSLEVFNGISAGVWGALAADSRKVYLVEEGADKSVFVAPHGGASAAFRLASGAPWEVTDAFAVTAYEPQDQSTSTVFVGTRDGNVFYAREAGASATLATGLDLTSGMAFATPTLYVSSLARDVVYAVDVNTGASSVFLARAAEGHAVVIPDLHEPFGLALDPADPTYLYVADETRILRVRIAP